MRKNVILFLVAVLFTTFAFANIYEIQFTEVAGDDGTYPSLLVDTEVTVTAIVTASNGENKFYIQDAPGGWNGVYLYSDNLDPIPVVGDEVTLTCMVTEYYGVTELTDVTVFSINSSGNDLPATTVVTTGEIEELYEGVLVAVEEATCTVEPDTYGAWVIDDGSGQVYVDDDFFSYAAVLDNVYNVTGPVIYSFSEYRILPRDENDISFGTTDFAAPEDVSVDVVTGVMSWFPPVGEGNEGWLQWCAEENNDGIGLNGGGTFSVASRWDVAQIAEYNGMDLTKISFFPNATARATFVVKVWMGENAANLVCEQDVTVTDGQWNEIILDTPITVDGSQELWFGYTVTGAEGEYPAGTDAGPAITGFGDMISTNGVNWGALSELAPDLNYNWNIKGFVENSDSRTVPMILVENDFDNVPLRTFDDVVKANLNNASALNREVDGYNVYLDDALVAENITDMEYAFTGLENDTEYVAGVAAVYPEGISNTVAVTFTYSGTLEVPTDLEVDATTGQMVWVAPVERNFAGTYNIYKNGVMIAEEIDEETYLMEGLLVGSEYVVGVTANHTEGESEAIEVTFTYIGTDEVLPVENLEVDASTGELTWNEPGSYVDNFEAYNVGDYLAEVSPMWTTWTENPGGSDDALISDAQANSGTNSVNVVGESDLILPMGDKITGTYVFEMQMYIPSGFGGYYNIQHYQNPGVEWAAEFYFGDDGNGEYNAGYPESQPFVHENDVWFNVRNVIDLDAQNATFEIDGTEIANWDFSLTAQGANGICQLGGVDIFAGAISGQTPDFYFDDVQFYEETSSTVASYNVYLGGTLVGNTTSTNFLLEDLNIGEEYTAGVAANYDSGEESEITEVTFTYGDSGSENDLVFTASLNDNYPNPFNPTTTISFSLETAGDVSLNVYNAKGQLVKTLVDEKLELSNHDVVWDGKDNGGKSVSSGIYFYRMQTKDFSSTKKMMLLK